MHLHKSIFVMRKQMLVFVLSVVISVLLLTFLFQYLVASIVAAILLLASLLYAFYYFVIWFYDVYTITNMRVLIIGRKKLFHTEFTDVSYGEISSVSYNVVGILATIFGYGTVTLGLADGAKVELVNLSGPGVVQETLKNLIEVTKRKTS